MTGEWNNVSLAIDVVLDKNSICPPSRDMDYENMSYCRGEEDNYGYNNYANNNGGGGGGSGGGRSYQSNGGSAGGYGENSYESSSYGNQSRSRNDSYSSNVITCSGDNGDSSNNAYSGYGQNYYGDKGYYISTRMNNIFNSEYTYSKNTYFCIHFSFVIQEGIMVTVVGGATTTVLQILEEGTNDLRQNNILVSDYRNTAFIVFQ